MLKINLREEIIEAKNEEELINNINPVISWNNFKPTESLNKQATLGGLEGNPDWVFSHTYPTTVIKEVLNGIKDKLNKTGIGVFPLDGYLGSGKSHLLLTLYHIFSNYKDSLDWFKKWNIEFPEIENQIVIPIPLQNINYINIWDPIFSALGAKLELAEDDWPRAKAIQEIVADKQVLILIDEIDNWYDAKKKEDKARIRGFIQSLCEVSQNSEYKINIIITFLGHSSDVKKLRDIVSRTRGGSTVVMQRSNDIYEIIRFRLFKNIDQNGMTTFLSDYLNLINTQLKKKNIEIDASLKDELINTYPFHPSLLRTLSTMKVRQMLIMLARLVKRKYQKTDLIITSDFDDDLLRSYLYSLNSKVIDAYFEDLNFVENSQKVKEEIYSFELCRGILLSSLLNTLETDKGADIKDIIYGCGTNYSIHEIEETINFLIKWTRLKKIDKDGLIRYIITTELPIAIKIERSSEHINDNEAINFIKDYTIKIVDVEIPKFRKIYDIIDVTNDRKLKILTLLEKPDDIKNLLSKKFVYKNTIYLLYPSYSLKSDETIKLVKRIIACNKYIEAGEQIKAYNEFLKDYLKHLKRQINNAGWRGFRWYRKNLIDKPYQDERTISNLKDVESIIQSYSNLEFIIYFLKLILEENDEISYRNLLERLFRLEGAPIILDIDNFKKIIIDMVKNGQTALKTKQGKIIFKSQINDIDENDFLIKPKTKSLPPTKGEVISLIKERNIISYRNLSERYPFIDKEVIMKIFQSAIDVKEEIYLINKDKTKIIKSSDELDKCYLTTIDEAAKLVEELILKIVNEEIIISVENVTKKLMDIYQNTGIDEDIVGVASNNLEIKKSLKILRRKNVINLQVLDDKLRNEMKTRIPDILSKKKEHSHKELVDEILDIYPTDKSLVEDAIAILNDEGKVILDLDEKKISLPEKEIKALITDKKILFKSDGLADNIKIEILDNFNKNEIAQDIRIEIIDDIKTYELINLIDNLKGKNIKLIFRRSKFD